ncbi:MAG UNVERIFIED_CONTAM: hypothetical protein LVR29_06640 [Microcystis novacekii LVE1205-3]|jgi:exopolysaccharide biosynthesis protein
MTHQKKVQKNNFSREDIEFVCETKPDKSPDKGKTIVAYTAYKEEREEPFKITLKGLMETLDASMADLLPEGLQEQSINFKNLMVIYRKERPKDSKSTMAICPNSTISEPK